MNRNNLGMLKKSFSIFYNNGDIWIEHLDGINNEKDLKYKFVEDLKQINRPSRSAYIVVILTETKVSEDFLSFILDRFSNGPKELRKVVFVGLNIKMKKYIRKKSNALNFIVKYIDDLEKAKEWLIHRNNTK